MPKPASVDDLMNLAQKISNGSADSHTCGEMALEDIGRHLENLTHESEPLRPEEIERRLRNLEANQNLSHGTDTATILQQLSAGSNPQQPSAYGALQQLSASTVSSGSTDTQRGEVNRQLLDMFRLGQESARAQAVQMDLLHSSKYNCMVF